MVLSNSNRKAFEFCFRFICTVVVTFMVGYWVYKYQIEDRDIGVVDYTQLKDEKDIEFPAISLCFNDPFLHEKLKISNSNITKESYWRYLAGELYDEAYEQIDYSNVTIDLSQYFQVASIRLHNGTKIDKSDSIIHTESFSGFSGVYPDFRKCFMIIYEGEFKRQIKQLQVVYDLKKLKQEWQDIQGIHKVYISAHYPGQFLLENEFSYMNLGENGTQYALIKFNEYEILKRRNSRQRKCLDVTNTYDEIIIDELVRDKGCRVPYVKGHRSQRKCKIQDGKIHTNDYQQMNVLKACQRISKIKTNIEKVQFLADQAMYEIDFPYEVKVITQSKDIDIHSLIGNIGGYLGLFLGRICN